jgi:membrane protease subunit (stomatin/prohibitin family)
MPLFEGHHPDKGVRRLFIEIPDDAKHAVVYKWPDQQIYQHSRLNVDLDYQAVFTNLGQVIGTLGPGRHELDEGASLALGWLVNRLTDDAYYDAEVYFVTTRDVTGVEFGGPLDNLTDGPTGLVVSVRVFGELALRVSDPVKLLSRLTGTAGETDYDQQIRDWVRDQAMAAIREVLPGVVGDHGVLAMGSLQEQTASAAADKANALLAAYGLAVSSFAELNVNLPDEDAHQLKQLAATSAYTRMSGSFDSAVRGETSLAIANGVAAGNVGADQALVAGLLLGTPLAPGQAARPATAAAVADQRAAAAAAQPAAAVAGPAETEPPRFCEQCGHAVSADARFCSACGHPLAG